MPLSFFVYTMATTIINKLGAGGLAIVAGLIAKGVITSAKDLKDYLDSL